MKMINKILKWDFAVWCLATVVMNLAVRFKFFKVANGALMVLLVTLCIALPLLFCMIYKTIENKK